MHQYRVKIFGHKPKTVRSQVVVCMFVGFLLATEVWTIEWNNFSLNKPKRNEHEYGKRVSKYVVTLEEIVCNYWFSIYYKIRFRSTRIDILLGWTVALVLTHFSVWSAILFNNNILFVIPCVLSDCWRQDILFRSPQTI